MVFSLHEMFGYCEMWFCFSWIHVICDVCIWALENGDLKIYFLSVPDFTLFVHSLNMHDSDVCCIATVVVRSHGSWSVCCWSQLDRDVRAWIEGFGGEGYGPTRGGPPRSGEGSKDASALVATNWGGEEVDILPLDWCFFWMGCKHNRNQDSLMGVFLLESLTWKACCRVLEWRSI